MRILARRAHGKAELSNKLRQRGFSTEDINDALMRATELGYMESDASIAQRYAEELAQKAGATPRWVQHKLAARGLDRAAIGAAVDHAFASWDAREAAWSFIRGDKDIPRVARRLERKGFSADVIGWTVRRLQSNVEET
ncbi:MAG: regulatory protein RecX [Myxococcota bacterium]